MSAAKKGAEPEPEKVCLHTFNSEQSAALEQFTDALGALGELAGYDGSEELDRASHVTLSRRKLGALFDMLQQAHFSIIGPDLCGHIWVDAAQVRGRTEH